MMTLVPTNFPVLFQCSTRDLAKLTFVRCFNSCMQAITFSKPSSLSLTLHLSLLPSALTTVATGARQISDPAGVQCARLASEQYSGHETIRLTGKLVGNTNGILCMEIKMTVGLAAVPARCLLLPRKNPGSPNLGSPRKSITTVISSEIWTVYA